jgi:hypothetical protein
MKVFKFSLPISSCDKTKTNKVPFGSVIGILAMVFLLPTYPGAQRIAPNLRF